MADKAVRRGGEGNDPEAELVARMRCPACGGKLHYQAPEGAGAQARCETCKDGWPRVAGVWRMLTGAQQTEYGRFIESYRQLRRAEGWERPAEYFLNLPNVAAGDPVEAIWRIRRRSFGQVGRLAGPGRGRWALDLGAGNGWLARYLARWGYRPVALDLNPTAPEGLEGGQLYLDHDAVWFGRVHESMDHLPFADSTFALCTVSGALHYADLRATLQGIWRVLAPGGLLIISDSPVYTQPAAGQTMAGEQRARAKRYLGQEPAPLPGGAGFLSQTGLLADLRQLGFETEAISIEHPLGRLRRRVRRVTRPGGREEARFPVIAARKPGGPP
jgi:SAM-dependent methyltransferase